jgi:hypothetical protein
MDNGRADLKFLPYFFLALLLRAPTPQFAIPAAAMKEFFCTDKYLHQ